MRSINLSERIDSGNAVILEGKISEELKKFPSDKPVFDAQNLEYISSAGLRVLLKISKKFGEKLDVINVSNEVYSIFDVTGFTELFNVRKKLREISAECLDVIGKGAFSTVYRLGPETILKVYTRESATLADVERDRLSSRKVFLRGIPTAIPFDTVKAGGHYGLVYEMIDTDTMSGTLAKNPERLEELSIKAAYLLKKLHTTEFEPGTFPDARDRQHARIQRAFNMNLLSQNDKDFADSIIDLIPYSNTFIHSDFHAGNLMVSGDDLILIDVGDAGLGNPINDFLVSYAHLVEVRAAFSENVRASHKRAMGLDYKMLGEIWKIIMREYFGTSDGEKLKKYSEIISVYASFMMLSISAAVCRMSSYEEGRQAAEKYMSRLRESASNLKPIEGI